MASSGSIFPSNKDRKDISSLQTGKLDRTWKIISSENHNIEDVLQFTLFGYCDSSDAATVAAASEQFNAIPQYKEAFDQNVNVLLQLTAKAEEKEVDKMVAQNYALILSKSTFTEELCGQRNWTKPISSLQYAAWAGDTDMVDMLLKYVPDHLKQEALDQLKEVRDKGTEHGKHLSAVLALSKEYKEYDVNFESWNWDQRDKQWLQIGLKQLHSVVNLLQWFCSRVPFHPVPSFSHQPEARRLSLWDGALLNLAVDSSLGSKFSLYKGLWCVEGLCCSEARWRPRRIDFAAVHHFCEVRTQDLTRQISQLEADLQKLIGQKPRKNSRCLWL